MTTGPSGAAAPFQLEDLGYTERWRELFAALASPQHVPARLVRTDRGSSVAATGRGLLRAEPSAQLRRAATSPDELPATGDWVVLDPAPTHNKALIDQVLPRTSAFIRGSEEGPSSGQVIAANVDVVFVVHPLATAPNLRRLERELALAWESGASPVVVLTKADLSDDVEAALTAVKRVALGADVLVTSATTGLGIDALQTRLEGRLTGALIGLSGAGKSTLANALLGEERLATREVRASDGRGRHQTVARELVPLPGGGVLLDTPGLRSVGMTDARDGLAAAFADIEEVAGGCRFGDCTHTSEPGCAVLAAVRDGGLPEERLASWHKLQREAHVAAMKTDARLRAEEARRWKINHKSARQFYRDNYRDTGRG